MLLPFPVFIREVVWVVGWSARRLFDFMLGMLSLLKRVELRIVIDAEIRLWVQWNCVYLLFLCGSNDSI